MFRMREAVGCLTSIVYFAIIGLLMVGNMLGDCFPELRHHVCPTDHERNVRILSIFIGGVLLYGLVYAIITAIIRWGAARHRSRS